MNYKTMTRDEARCLARHWMKMGVKVKIENLGPYSEVQCLEPDGHPMWREICDAFIAGWDAAAH
jgi:hypothetical protein